MRLLFLNQYAPPDPSPTARLMGELAGHLLAKGHQVEMISPSGAYQGHHVSTGSRLRREIRAARTILRVGLRAKVAGKKPDLLVSLSSPPCLLVVAALIALVRRVPLAHWAMDLYPELAVTLGEIPNGSLLARVLRGLMGWAYRRCVLIVTLDADMATHLERCYRVASKVLPPWPAAAIHGDKTPTPVPPRGARLAAERWTWLYSGNLGRAHEWRPLLDAQAELERRGLSVQLVFEGGGPNWQPARQYAEQIGLRHCQWPGYASEAQCFQSLQASGLVVAAQNREAVGLLWPSKLARIIPLNKPLLWIGPLGGAVARSLGHRTDTACFDPNDTDKIARWIEDLYWQNSSFPAVAIADGEINRIYEHLIQASCRLWEEWLLSAITAGS